MKTMSKRSKSIVTIAGSIVVLAIAVALVITQTPVGGLLGATKLSITPTNPTIVGGQSFTLTANAPTTYAGTWIIEKTNMVTGGGAGATNQAMTFTAVGLGTTRITFKPASALMPSVATNVTVIAPTLAILPDLNAIRDTNPHVFTINTGDPNCTWTFGSGSYIVGSNSGPSVTIQVATLPTSLTQITLRAECTYGLVSRGITVCDPVSGHCSGRQP